MCELSLVFLKENDLVHKQLKWGIHFSAIVQSNSHRSKHDITPCQKKSPFKIYVMWKEDMWILENGGLSGKNKELIYFSTALTLKLYIVQIYTELIIFLGN